jgi:iron complex outermembrane receptor protein
MYSNLWQHIRKGGNEMAEIKKYSQLTGVLRKTTPYFALFLFGLMLLGHPVLAQTDTSSDESAKSQEEFLLEDVVVTGSVIRTKGLETPNPVTVITVEELEIIAPTNLIESLAELPQFFGSTTTQTGTAFFTSAGAGTLNLRGLNGKNTLQLLDGRRVVQSTLFGGTDINMFPEFLLKSVDTITGGATATYGTGAVAGAVNFILNTDYEGIKAKVQYGETAKGHNQNYKVEVAGGFDITDRIHMLFSVEKEDQDPIWNKRNEYGWYVPAAAYMSNPASGAGSSPDNPRLIPMNPVYSRNFSPGGVFVFGGTIGNYIWEDGVFVPYSTTGLVCSNAGCVGGQGSDQGYWYNSITPDSGRENVFGYIDFDVNDSLKIYGQVLYGKSDIAGIGTAGSNYNGAAGLRAFTIYRENPFLPPEIAQIMDANGKTSVTFGREGSPLDLANDVGTKEETETLSLTGGVDYEIGSGFFEGWQVRGYVQHGETDYNGIQHGGVRVDRIYLAADVVIDPLTGQPACNVTVTSRNAGTPIYQDCVPINLFGEGNASAEAIDWVKGFEPGVAMHADGFISPTESLPYDYISDGDKTRVLHIDQDVYDIRIDGELYEGWGAGPVIMGLGYGYREESFTQKVKVGPGGNVNVDPSAVAGSDHPTVMPNNAALGIRGVAATDATNYVEIQFSKVPFSRGDQYVHEAFTEFLVPLVAGKPFVKQLNVDFAARWANYDGIHKIWSWKGGLVYHIVDDIRLRSTYSKDLRAATMAEKFDRTGGLGAITDYGYDISGTADASKYQITIYSNGSPDIKPENAQTTTIGFVYQPRWLEGLNFTADFYNVEIKDNITAMGAAAVVEGCYLYNDDALCEQITRTGEPFADRPDLNKITFVGTPYINQASVQAHGVDFDASYTTPVDWFGGGESVGLRLMGSYLGERSSTNANGVKTRSEGLNGLPEWNGTLSGWYKRGPFRLYLQARFTGEMLKNGFPLDSSGYNANSGVYDISDNVLDSTIIVDTRVNYTFEVFDGFLDLYLNVNNLLNKWPQQNLATWGYFPLLYGDPGLGVTGDLRGRRYTIGAMFEYGF